MTTAKEELRRLDARIAALEAELARTRVMREAQALLVTLPADPAAGLHREALGASASTVRDGKGPGRNWRRDPIGLDRPIVPVLKKRRTTWAC